jgi:hypothetical protein
MNEYSAQEMGQSGQTSEQGVPTAGAERVEHLLPE